ncbi:MAG: gliding motility-associated ABC transporter permease subunit GldF [Flavobacteriales bacterium]
MLALLQKEIKAFLSSLIGYIVIIVFLLLIGLIMWVFPTDMNVLNQGYASLETLFNIAPWVFMFLIPAITMRFFSEEKRTGTIELLLTKPLTDLQIILSKYFAGLLLVLFSLIPTLFYFGTIYYLGSPVGNVDVGGTWGSYIGLLLLGGGFVSIGVFASSMARNQVVAFIIAVFLCFITYIGFDSLASLPVLGSIDHLIVKLGINEHYISISRGVLDTRDLLYFLSLSAFFILLTKLVLESRKW